MLGINNALAMMKEGGKLSVIIPGEQAMKDYVPMLYNLELIKVIDDNSAYEDTVVHAFLDKNSFTPENQVDTSLWVKIISGDGISTDSAAAGDTVYITYTGRLVDYLYDSVYTRVIDKSSIRYLYNSKILSGQMLSTGNNVMPKCVQLAIDLMKEGDKARILSLYEYAFGKDGIVDKKYKYTVIPKLQTVSYDVEITSIKKK
jgi:FKBP-type peptidyl-prolyl cis-trans isomerase